MAAEPSTRTMQRRRPPRPPAMGCATRKSRSVTDVIGTGSTSILGGRHAHEFVPYSAVDVPQAAVLLLPTQIRPLQSSKIRTDSASGPRSRVAPMISPVFSDMISSMTQGSPPRRGRRGMRLCCLLARGMRPCCLLPRRLRLGRVAIGKGG